MIYTLSGENSFGLAHALSDITNNFLAEHGDLALQRIDGETADYDQMREALQSPPFLATQKMVVLRRPSANKQFVEHAEALLSEIDDTTILVIVEPKLDKRSAYYKYVNKKTQYQEYKMLDQAGLSRWLVESVSQQEGVITLAVANFLVERVGTDQQLLSSEIAKLLLYSPTVTKESVMLLTEETPQSTIFQLLEAAFAGRRKRTLELYAEQRALKVEPQQIIALLGWQLHILAVVAAGQGKSADSIASEAKLSPYVVRKTQGIARKTSIADVRRMVHELSVIDMRSKRSAINLDDALQYFLISL